MMARRSVLLHICCAPDGIIPFEREPGEVDGYFYNPCIHPREEWERRAAACRLLTARMDRPVQIDDSGWSRWEALTTGMETLPEKSERCRVCMEMRLAKTAAVAAERGYDAFATSLTTSPHKPVPWINETGECLARQFGITYLVSDYKKRDGFKRSVTLSRKWGMYRQSYCGCRFSMGAGRAAPFSPVCDTAGGVS